MLLDVISPDEWWMIGAPKIVNRPERPLKLPGGLVLDQTLWEVWLHRYNSWSWWVHSHDISVEKTLSWCFSHQICWGTSIKATFCHLNYVISRHYVLGLCWTLLLKTQVFLVENTFFWWSLWGISGFHFLRSWRQWSVWPCPTRIRRSRSCLVNGTGKVSLAWHHACQYGHAKFMGTVDIYAMNLSFLWMEKV